MDEFTRTPPAQDLLAQAGRLHAIARRLVGDGHAADDLVQDTWVAALEARLGPEGGPGIRTRDAEGWRAWARVVTRNLSLRRARRDRERRALEREAAQPEASDERDELAERMELQRKLGDAILTLEEPYRGTVVARYLDGLSFEVIAKRENISNATVRKRCSRALAMLRARLTGESESGSTLMGAWLGWLLPRPTTLTAGGVFMGTKANVGIAVSVIAALVVVWMVREDPLAGVTYPEDQEARQPAVLEAPIAEASQDLERTEPLVAVENEARLPDEVVQPAAQVLRGKVTNTSGEPLAEVSITQFDGQGNSADESTVVLTDDAGRYELTQLPNRSVLSFALESYESLNLHWPEGEEFDATLLRSPRMAGQVRSKGSGLVAPPGMVEVKVQYQGSSYSAAFETDIQPDGTYLFEDLPVGQLVSVTSRAKGFDTYEADRSGDLVPEQTLALDIELPRGLTIAGVVRDSATKEPVPFAKVWSREFAYDEASVKPSATADAEGRYRLEGVELAPYDSAPENVHVVFLTGSSPNHIGSPYDMQVVAADEQGFCQHDIELTPANSTLKVVFLEPGGTQPATGLQVWIIDEAHNFASHVTDEKGEIDFGTQPVGTFGLFANRRHRGKDGNHNSLRVELELGAGEQKRLELELMSDKTTSLSGRVLDAQGSPLPDFSVVLSYKLEFKGLVMPHSADAAISDADGRYQFTGLRAGKYQLERATCMYPKGAEFELDWGEHHIAEDLIAGKCMKLTGQIDLGERSLEGLWLQLQDAETGANVHFARPDEDGGFEFENIAEGEYDIVLRDFVDGEVLDLDRVLASEKQKSGLVLRIP